jgi:hypothetical protein
MRDLFRLSTLTIALIDFFSVISAQIIPIRYPWATYNSQLYQNHQENLLNQIKSMSFSILSENLPEEFLNPSSLSPLFYTGPNYEEYSCNLTTPTTSLTSQNSGDGTRGGKLSPLEIKNQTEMKVLRSLKDLCLQYQVDWWSYQWCSENAIEQFHLERGRKGKVIKDPLWSLGNYDFTEYDREERDDGKSNDEADLVRVRQYFSKGQICHENNHQRSSEVHLPVISLSFSFSSCLYLSLCRYISLAVIGIARIDDHLMRSIATKSV